MATRRIKLSPYIAKRIGRTKKDFRVDTFATGSVGGANANCVNSGVRIVDLITGLSSESRCHRDQPQNKATAFHSLVLKMIDFYRKEEFSSIVRDKEPSRARRTYNEKGSRVTDHKTGISYDYRDVLDGKGLDKIIKDNMERSIDLAP